MPRIPRGLVAGYAYHVLNRGNDRKEVFRKPKDYQAFQELMWLAGTRHAVRILAYCLMPNHFHIVLIPLEPKNLSCWVQWLLTSHVRRYHKHYAGSGHVWQGRFKSFPVQEDDHLITVMRYVERNPLNAGLVGSAKDWPWSSHRQRIGKCSPTLLDASPVALPKDWSGYVDSPFRGEELREIEECLQRQSPFGFPEWKQTVASSLGLESTLRPRGRPRKVACPLLSR